MKRVALLIGVVLLLAACGGGGGNSTTDQITAAYTNFFTKKGSLAAHVALIEDGAKFKPVIQSFFGNPLAGSARATVSSVRMQGPDKAKVVYTLKIQGFSLANQTGYAVLQGGKWKVADSTVCGLLSLDGIGAPSVCKK